MKRNMTMRTIGADRTTKTEQPDIRFRDVLAMEYTASLKKSDLVLSKGGHACLPCRPEKVIDEWCLTHGSSMRGRIDSLKALLGQVRKPPVLVSESEGVFFIPMRASVPGADNLWINESQILKISQPERGTTRILFLNGALLEIPYDIRMVKRQREICERYRKLLYEYRTLDAPVPFGK